MGRILFFLLLGVGLYVAYRLWRAGPADRGGAGRSGPPAAAETMVRCQHCGLNVPESEAVADSGRWFCSDAHRRLGRDSG